MDHFSQTVCKLPRTQFKKDVARFLYRAVTVLASHTYLIVDEAQRYRLTDAGTVPLPHCLITEGNSEAFYPRR